MPFLSLGLLLAGSRFLVLTPLPNLPKIGGHESDPPPQLFHIVLKTDCKVQVAGGGMLDDIEAEV